MIPHFSASFDKSYSDHKKAQQVSSAAYKQQHKSASHIKDLPGIR